jgi:hypothetical protein
MERLSSQVANQESLKYLVAAQARGRRVENVSAATGNDVIKAVTVRDIDARGIPSR